MSRPLIGCAGWSISKQARKLFPLEGSHLSRYSAVLPAVEINSSFYRSHRRTTYERWARETPESFRFSVKAPKTITHDKRIRDCDELIRQFLEECAGLGHKLSVVLVQLPPSLPFDREIASRFFDLFTPLDVAVACEPRHASWFDSEAEDVLAAHEIARVAADPAIVPHAAEPAGWRGLEYWRLHGSPRLYASAYEFRQLQSLAASIRGSQEPDRTCWCVFDNTMFGSATDNAVQMRDLLAGAR